MSKQDHKTDAGGNRPSPMTRDRFEQERLMRRAMLRRLGLTAGASLFGLAAADDVVRATVAKMRETEALRGVADSVAVEFRNAGVAFAQASGPGNDAGSYCGVTAVPCIQCGTVWGPPQTGDGPPPPPPNPCPGDPYCRQCEHPTDCDDCLAVADYKYCNCMQQVINDNPGCFTNGSPNGTCPNITVPIGVCDRQHEHDQEVCN